MKLTKKLKKNFSKSTKNLTKLCHYLKKFMPPSLFQTRATRALSSLFFSFSPLRNSFIICPIPIKDCPILMIDCVNSFTTHSSRKDFASKTKRIFSYFFILKVVIPFRQTWYNSNSFDNPIFASTSCFRIRLGGLTSYKLHTTPLFFEWRIINIHV